MIQTPQQFKRKNLKNLFEKILKSEKVRLEPLGINISEDWQSDFTFVDLSYRSSQGDNSEILTVKEPTACGFVDGIFKLCHKETSKLYRSLANVRLHNYRVCPNFIKEEERSSAAEVEVAVMMDVRDHGIAEFNSVSRSVLRSSFAGILSAFEFYINCERSFHKIQLILSDAQDRNRSDIVEKCKYDLARLTGVNNYEREEN